MRFNARTIFLTLGAILALAAIAGMSQFSKPDLSSGKIVRLPDGSEIRNVAEIGPGGDALLAREKGQYDISYTKSHNQFTITVYGGDFSETRRAAEEKFVSLAGNGSRESACKLNVRIVPFPKAYPELRDSFFLLNSCTL